MDYGFEHNGKVFTPNATPDISAADNDARNKAIEAAELAHWQTRPDRMLAYYDVGDSFQQSGVQGVVKTWLGSRLGVVISHRIYRHNLGGRFVSMRVKGSNGTMYYGRASYDWGSCINLRRMK